METRSFSIILIHPRGATTFATKYDSRGWFVIDHSLICPAADVLHNSKSLITFVESWDESRTDYGVSGTISTPKEFACGFENSRDCYSFHFDLPLDSRRAAVKFLKGICHRSDKEQKKKKKRREGKEEGLYKERRRIRPPERGLFSSGYRPLPFVRKINFPVSFLFRPRSLTTHTRPPNKNVSCCCSSAFAGSRFVGKFKRRNYRQRL